MMAVKILRKSKTLRNKTRLGEGDDGRPRYGHVMGDRAVGAP